MSREVINNLKLALQKLYVVETNLSMIRDKRIPKVKKLLEDVRVLLSSTKRLVSGEGEASLNSFDKRA